jgi:uracil-DNA glycosylase
MSAAPDMRLTDELTALFDFYIASGAALALEDVPQDQFAKSAAELAIRRGALEKPASSSAFMAPASILASPETTLSCARHQAETARTLEDLQELLRHFDGCGLKATARQLVFADGNPGSRVMLIGEAPGADEDRIGRPFVGRAGQLLDRMLVAIGLDRNDVYMANVVPWRPPGNRTPTMQEIALCRPFLERQIALAAPDIIVTLGGPAAQTLAGTKEGILKARGQWFSLALPERTLPILVTLHPAYLLRQPLQKRLAWRDFLTLRKRLENPAMPLPPGA